MIDVFKNKNISKYTVIFLLVLFFLILAKNFDINVINNLIINEENNIDKLGILTLISLFSLRFISILFPMIPGTYCSVLAGYLYGFSNGLLLIFFADLFSCSLSFLIARKLGREFLLKLLGQKQMQRIENISQKYLENNFFLMTASLMTQFFDFVCYAIGLTKVSWKRFMPALIISILISDAPFVAGGYAFKDIKEITLKNIINGDINLIYGNYLLIFIISILAITSLGILNILINNNLAKRIK